MLPFPFSTIVVIILSATVPDVTMVPVKIKEIIGELYIEVTKMGVI